MGGDVGCGSGGSGSVHVGFFLEFSNVFLVSDSLISKPVGYLRDCNGAFLCQLLLGLLAGVRVA